MGRLVLVIMAIAASLVLGSPSIAQDSREPAVRTTTVQASPTEGETRREELISKCRSWEHWYRWWSDIYAALWHAATTAVIVLTALTSLLVALNLGQAYKWQIVSLSAIAGLLTTFSVQFRLKENWQLREMGRLEVLALTVEARSLRASDPDLREKAFAIEQRLINIDRAQAGFFFETLFSDQQRRTERMAPGKS